MTDVSRSHDPEPDDRGGVDPEELSSEDVREAVRRHDVFLVYQPVLSFEPRRLVGAEALARWVHPELGMVPPGQFLARVEELGLMPELSGRLLREACDRAAGWPAVAPAARGKELLLQFNVSPSELEEADLPAKVSDILRERDFPPERLRLEMGEEAVREHPDLMRELASLGISLMVHDYGVRAAEEEENDPRPLGIDALKIDRTVIQGLGNDPRVADTVERAVALGHERGLEVVAEGVETEAQVWHLQRLGCELGQGFRLKPPMEARDFRRYCESRFR
jgi:EAL domain-containing protein (putative c-di-GMP-specific phosphodiesterase class I)